MKDGAGDDLLSDISTDDDSNDGDAEQDDEFSVEFDTEPTTDDAEMTDEVPYLLRRNRVKEGRETVGFGLQEDTRRLENRVLRELKTELDIEKLLATDLREAAYLAGLEDPDQIKKNPSRMGLRTPALVCIAV